MVENCDDNMLSRFHLILERNGQTDGRTDLLYQYRASVHKGNKLKKQQIGDLPTPLFYIYVNM